MTLFTTVLIIFLLTLVGIVVNHAVTTKNLDTIRRLRGEEQQLSIRREEAVERVSSLRQRERMLRMQLEDIERGLQAVDLSLAEAGTGEEQREEQPLDYSGMIEKPRKIARGETAVLESFVREKRITPNQLQKARDYKIQTGSEYSLEDILVMLGYLRQEDVEVAKRRFGA